MNILIGTEKDKSEILAKYPYTKQTLGTDGILIVAINDVETIGFLWAFIRDIPGAVNEKELFINVIEVFDTQHRCKGIGSCLVEKCIEVARLNNCYQVRAYCDINNISSNMLWKKNGFAISPVVMEDNNIPGSYVAYKL